MEGDARQPRWPLRNLVVVLAYLASALAALSFGDPAAPAVAVFPPAGIALAVTLAWGRRILPAVFTGALLTNLYMLWRPEGAGVLALLGAVGISLTSTFQAWLGSRLCEHYARLPADTGWHELRLLLLGGVMACSVAAVGGNLVHLGTGNLAAVDLPRNLWTWWVGDALGVALFTPLILQGLDQQRRRPGQWWAPFLAPGVVLVVVLLAHSLVSLREQARLEAGFHQQARVLVERLNLRIAGYSEALRSLRRLWQSSREVDADEFHAFVGDALARHPDIRLLAWAPVSGDVPRLQYVEPATFAGLRGQTLASSAALRQAVAEARDSGQLVAVREPGLRGDGRLRDSKVLLDPIYRNGTALESAEARRAAFLGVAVMAFDLRPDTGSGGDAPLLLRIEERGQVPPARLHDSPGVAEASPLVVASEIVLDARPWTVTVSSPVGYHAAHRSQEAYLVFSALLALVSVLLALALVLRRSQAWQSRTEAAERARGEAEREARGKSAFLATMSHEIRTPMNGVIGMTQLLAETKLDADQQHYVGTIRRSCEALLRILNDILDYSKIDAGRLRIETVAFDLRPLMEECCSLFSPHSRQSGIALDLEMAGDLPVRVSGDPVRIRQVLINLLGNAFKFTRQGRVVLRVHSQRTAKGKPELRFEVHDTGIGIADVQRARLFESFSQGDSSITRKYGGTGLGLSICRLLVDLMGGQIGVHTVYGRGSMFWFTLPLLTAEGVLPEAGTGPGAEVAATAPPASGSGLRVLVVEDNPVNQQVIAGFLRRHGITPRVVGDGVEALHVLTAERQAFDAVFMDCEMPNMDGYSATERIRQWEHAERRAPMFICGVSAHVIAEYRERALVVGMDDFIAKPLQRQELERILGILQAQSPMPQAL